MRILKINGSIIDIDDKTSIGITYQAFDIKEPAKRKFVYSNDFTLPLTDNNRNIIDNCHDVQSNSDFAYNQLVIDYWIDNNRIINQAAGSIEEISDRIYISVRDAKTFWEQLKEYTWRQLEEDIFDWFTNVRGFINYNTATFYSGSLAQFLQGQYTDLLTPAVLGNTKNYDPLSQYENAGNDFLAADHRAKTVNGNDFYHKAGHVFVFASTLFKFLEYKFNINLGASETFDGNMWNNGYLEDEMMCPLKQFEIEGVYIDSVLSGYKYSFIPYDDTHKFLPETSDYIPDKSVYDVINPLLQMFSVVIEPYRENGLVNYKMLLLDEIENVAPVIDWSGKIKGTPKFKPAIDKYAQNSWITYASMYGGGSEKTSGINITCDNKNLETETNLFSVSCKCPEMYVFDEYATEQVLDMSNDLNDIVWIWRPRNQTAGTYEWHYFDDYSTISGNVLTPAAMSLDFSGRTEIVVRDPLFQFLTKIAKKPKFYEIEKWLTIEDMRDFSHYKLYYIREINGCFFVNKISGFNPEKSLQPTKIELIKVNNRTPDPSEFTRRYWIDGQEYNYIDGDENKYY